MKLKFESKDKWVKKQRDITKRKGRMIVITLLVMITVLGASILYRTISISKGLFYKTVTLEDSPKGTEPKTETCAEFSKIIKCPTLNYTLIAGDDIVREEDSYCVFLKDKMYISIMEVSAAATTDNITSQVLIPSIGGTVASTNTYKKVFGYLNERRVETIGITTTLNNKTRLYSENIRVLLGEKDLLISVVSTDTDMEKAYSFAYKVFMSMREITPLDEDDETISAPVTDTQESQGSSVITFDESGQTIDPLMKEDKTEGEDGPAIEGAIPQYSTSPLPSWEKPTLLERDVKAYVEVPEEMQNSRIYFCYTTVCELTDIILTSPDGKREYMYTEFTYGPPYTTYTFCLDTIEAGTWTITFNSAEYIGNYYYGCIKDSDFNMQYGL